MFTEEQIERYSRHIILKDVGGKGQKKLLDGRVLIIGAGGLGSPIALYLAAAGVGTIGIADADVVDLSNLQRQIAHHTGDIGTPKVLSAAAKMTAMNPDVTVNTYHEWISAANILDIIPAPPPKDAIPTCSSAGVIGVLPGVLGTIQATEAIKYLLGKGELLTNRLLTYNALRMRFREVPIRKNPRCPICGESPTITELKDELDAMNVCEMNQAKG